MDKTKIVCAIQLFDGTGNESFIGPFGYLTKPEKMTAADLKSGIKDKKDLEEAQKYIKRNGLKRATPCFVRGSTQMEKVV